MTQSPSFLNPYQPSASEPLAIGSKTTSIGYSTGGLIPYKNPSALIAYYLAIFSLLPIIGLFLGMPAFVLGILGLWDRKRNPAIKGWRPRLDRNHSRRSDVAHLVFYSWLYLWPS